MDDSQKEPQGASGPERGRDWLLERAVRERWVIGRDVRRAVIERMKQIVADPVAQRSEACEAAKLILEASKLNLANIVATIRADHHTDLDRRMTEIEREIKARKGEAMYQPNPWSA
jgi:hypothetical protein